MKDGEIARIEKGDQQAGITDNDRERQAVLEKVEALPSLDDTRRKEAVSLADFARRWNESGLKFYGASVRGKPHRAMGDYDFSVLQRPQRSGRADDGATLLPRSLSWGVHPSALLLLRRDDPAAFLAMLEHLGRQALEETAKDWLCDLAYTVMLSPMPALGVMVAQRLIPIISKRTAVGLLDHIMKARDRSELPPQDPFADLLDKRFSDEVADEGKDAEELRVARQKLEAKTIAERQKNEELRQAERQVRLLEKRLAEQAKPADSEVVDKEEMRRLREKVRELKSNARATRDDTSQARRNVGDAYAGMKTKSKEKESLRGGHRRTCRPKTICFCLGRWKTPSRRG